MVLLLGCPEGQAILNTANALQQYPLDMASSNKRIKEALKQAGATPSPHWSGKAGRDVYENTRARNTGASDTRQLRAARWREEQREGQREGQHQARSHGGASSSSWQWSGWWGQ